MIGLWLACALIFDNIWYILAIVCVRYGRKRDFFPMISMECYTRVDYLLSILNWCGQHSNAVHIFSFLCGLFDLLFINTYSSLMIWLVRIRFGLIFNYIQVLLLIRQLQQFRWRLYIYLIFSIKLLCKPWSIPINFLLDCLNRLV